MRGFCKWYLAFFTSFLFQSIAAQKQVSFFADSFRKGDAARAFSVVRKDQFVYMAGQSFDSVSAYAYTPSVSKIDTAGNTLWTYSTNRQIDVDDNFFGGSLSAKGSIDQLILDGEFLYASGYMPQTQKREIWKIQEKTGDLVWKREISTYDSRVHFRVTSKDSLLVGYNAANLNDGYIYQIWEKRTGKILSSKTIPQISGFQYKCFFELDKDGSLYFVQDDNILKFQSATASQLVWKKRLDYVDIAFLKLETDGCLYAIGRHAEAFASTNPMRAIKLEKSAGNILWNVSSALLPYFLYDEPSDVKITNQSIFISGKQTGLGSVSTAYRVWKLDRANGTTHWDKAYNSFWQQDTIPSGGAQYTSILSLDVDSFENVYATGYQQAGDILSGVWGVCKLNGGTGKLIYLKTIHEAEPYNSKYSRGVYTFVFNNRVFHLGELQKSSAVPATLSNYSYSSNFIIATDTTNIFNSYRKQKITAFFQYFSRVAAIKNFSDSKFVVYKQLGNAGVVEMRHSSNGNLAWSKTIALSKHFTADQMCVTADDKIAISALGHVGTSHFPLQYDYVKKPDSAYFLKLDSSGEIQETKRYYIGNREFFMPIQFFATKDTNTVFVYSQKDQYGNNPSLHFFNVSKGTRPVGDFGDYVGAVYTPTQTRQQLLIPITKDSALAIYYRIPYNVGNNLIFQKYKFTTTSYGTGVQPVSLKFFAFDIRHIHNLASCDSTSVLFMGKTSGGAAVIVKYNHKANAISWKNTEALGYLIESATATDKMVYWMGRKNNDLVIRQSNLHDGSMNWEYIVAAGSQRYYVPVEQKFNKLRNEYTVSGYLVDSASSKTFQSPFYIVLDSIGNVKKHWTEVADYNMENGLSAMEVTQYGQTLLGGALYKTPFGRSGVFIEADSALALPSSTISLCPLGSLTITSQLTGINYQWQLSTDSIIYNNIINNQFYTGANTSALTLHQIPSSHYGHWFRCVVDGTASTSYKIKFVNTWLGTNNSAWEDPANWSCGSLPDDNTDVIIGSGNVAVSANTTIRSLTLLPGAHLTVASGTVLTVRF